MKIDRKILGYVSSIMVAYLLVEGVRNNQWIFSGIVALVYLAFVFGVDKFVIDLKNKKVEIDDADEK